MITFHDVENTAVGFFGKSADLEIIHTTGNVSGFQVTVYTVGGGNQTFFHDSDTVEGMQQKMSLWIVNAVHPLARAAA
jgi:hypothetical protein